MCKEIVALEFSATKFSIWTFVSNVLLFDHHHHHHYHHHCSVNTSTINAPIENQTTGGGPLRCYLSSVNSIKNLYWFCIAGCGLLSLRLPS